VPEEVRLWTVQGGDTLHELERSPLDLEARLEVWLEHDISILSHGLLVIGRQVKTDFGGLVDLLCLDQTGDVVVVELKRDKTPREITAQILDYGSWVKDLSNEQITAIGEAYLGGGKLDEAFNRRFGIDLPETLNENHRLLIVASQIDPSSERIIKYLSDAYGVNINAATFEYFKQQNGSELLARVFLIDPAEVEGQTRTKSKRRRNLTYQELEAIAEEKGVQELYRHAVANFERYFQKHTTRSSIGFTAVFNGSRKTVVSLIPQESNSSEGLRFQLYSRRLRTWLNLSENADLPMLPPRHDPWIYYESAGPDFEGFQGFFSNPAEVDHFIEGLARLQKTGAI
jgi:hypothetical protein